MSEEVQVVGGMDLYSLAVMLSLPVVLVMLL